MRNYPFFLFLSRSTTNVIGNEKFILLGIPSTTFGVKRGKCSMQSDKLKMDLLRSQNIQLLLIPNQYVKHFEFIRELINKFNGDVYQQTLFDGYDGVN